MIITEEEANLRLESSDNLCNKLIEIRKLHTHVTHTPIEKAIAGIAHLNGEPCRDVEEWSGIGKTTVNDVKNGDLLKHTVQTAHERALDTMLASMDLIKPKLENVKKATDLSKIAADMARVVEKTSPKEANQTNIKVVVFSPTIKVEGQYEEMVVNS